MAAYDIETYEDDDGFGVRIVGDDILENQTAMDAVGREIRREWGQRAETIGRGCSYFDRAGKEAGWQWMVTSGRYAMRHTYDGYVVYCADAGQATDVYIDSEDAEDAADLLNRGMAEHDDYEWREWADKDTIG